jgi:hypothetical protein
MNSDVSTNKILNHISKCTSNTQQQNMEKHPFAETPMLHLVSVLRQKGRI